MITLKYENDTVDELTVSEFKELLTELEDEGYGKFKVRVGYDDNYCYTTPSHEYNVVESDGSVYFDVDAI